MERVLPILEKEGIQNYANSESRSYEVVRWIVYLPEDFNNLKEKLTEMIFIISAKGHFAFALLDYIKDLYLV